MKKKKIFLILIPVIVVLLVLLFVLGIFRAKNEIPARWESDIYQHSKYDCQVKNVLIILPNGETVKQVLRAEGNMVLSSEFGTSDIKKFKVKYSTPSEPGVTVYKYNPLTNRLKSGERVYKQGRKSEAPEVSAELLQQIEGEWGYIGVKCDEILFQDNEVQCYIFDTEGNVEVKSYVKFGTDQFEVSYPGVYTVDESTSTITVKFDLYGKGELEERKLIYSYEGDEMKMLVSNLSAPQPYAYKMDWSSIAAEIRNNDMDIEDVKAKYSKYIRGN